MLSFNYAGAGLCILGAHFLVSSAIGTDSKIKEHYACYLPFDGRRNEWECAHIAPYLQSIGIEPDPQVGHFCVPSSADSDSYMICVARSLVNNDIQYPLVDGVSPGYWKLNDGHWDMINCPKDEKVGLAWHSFALPNVGDLTKLMYIFRLLYSE
jgi:hypothetical protein